MAHLLNTLVTQLYYSYFIKFRPNKNQELIDSDRLFRLGTNNSFYKPSFMYADYGRVMTHDQLEALHMENPYYPDVYTPEDPDLKFSLDKVVRNIKTYLVVPLAATTDISTVREYIYQEDSSPIQYKMIPMFWEESQYFGLNGGIEPTGKSGETFTPELSSIQNNLGVIYFAFPYFGPREGDPDFVEKFWTSPNFFPTLKALYDTGGSTPQEVTIGNSFSKASNRNKSIPAYMKISIVDSNNDLVCYKTANELVTQPTDYSLRVTLTRPLPEAISFDIEFGTDMNLDLVLPDTNTRLKEAYGIETNQFNQMSVRKAKKMVQGVDFIPSSTQVNMGIGVQLVKIPITFNPSSDRMFTEIQIKNIEPRDDLKLLNNSILFSTHDGTLNEDISDQGLMFILNIYENGQELSETILGDGINYFDALDGHIYTAKVRVISLDVVSAALKYRYNQPMTGAYQAMHRHIFYHFLLENGSGVQKNNEIRMVTNGEVGAFHAGSYLQEFEFDVNLGSSESELTLQVTNDACAVFNGKKVLRTPFVGFTFRKV